MIGWADLEGAAAAAWMGLTTLCSVASVIDAALPQPVAGSKWLTARRIVATLAVNHGAARNRVQPGSVLAAVERVSQPAPLAVPTPVGGYLTIRNGVVGLADAPDPMPAAAPPAAPASVPPAVTGFFGVYSMNALSILRSLWDDVFSAKAQQQAASFVEHEVGTVAAIAQKALSVAAVATLAATASGVLPGDAAKVAATAVNKFSETVTALQSVPTTATDVAGLLSDGVAMVKALPIGSNDRAHVDSALSGLQLLFAGTSAAAQIAEEHAAPVAVTAADGSAAAPVAVPETSAS